MTSLTSTMKLLIELHMKVEREQPSDHHQNPH